MTDTSNPTQTDEPKADETFTWTNATPPPDPAKGTGAAPSTAATIIETVREVVDELAERAAPTVRELSARAAELTATAADKAAPLVRRAGEATADASGKLATRSREWASGVRASVATAERETGDQAGDEAAPATKPDEPASN